MRRGNIFIVLLPFLFFTLSMAIENKKKIIIKPKNANLQKTNLAELQKSLHNQNGHKNNELTKKGSGSSSLKIAKVLDDKINQNENGKKDKDLTSAA